MGYYKLLYFRWSPNKTNQKKLLWIKNQIQIVLTAED
jgi:hypothetical protein